MGVKETGIQLQHGLTSLTETEMPRLNDTGMNRSYRHFKDALSSGYCHIHTALAAHLSRFFHLLAQRVIIFGKGIMQYQRPWVRMPLRHNAEHILNLAFIPGSRRYDRR